MKGSLVPSTLTVSTSLVFISLLHLWHGQTQGEVALTSRCLTPNRDIEMTCTALDVESLRWFFNGSDKSSYNYVISPGEVCPSCSLNFDSMLSGINVTVKRASSTGGDRFSAVSVLSANVQSLMALNVWSVECGSATTQSPSVIVDFSIQCTTTLILTSQPRTSGTYCPGPVTFTCVGTEINSSMSWLVNGSNAATYYLLEDAETLPPQSLNINPPLDGITAEVTSASTNANVTNTVDITSVLHVSDISVLNGASLQCEDASGVTSEVLNIEVNLLSAPPSPSFTSCSLLPSPGGAEVSLQWSPSFTSQYAVERYRVSVNPDPSSCSSEQVSPSEDYSCSGLVLGTLYTFTVSAINCGNQEGDRNTFAVMLESLMEPTDLEVVETDGQQNYLVQWRQSSVVSEGCSTVGGVSSVDYIVTSVDSAGDILDQEVVTSDSCNNSLCSTSISGADICGVEVLATSLFGNSTSISKNVGVPLTTANQVLLAIGVGLLLIAVGITVILVVIVARTKKGIALPRLVVSVIVVGCVLVLMSVLLWMGVAELHNEFCGSSTRSNLIIAAHVFSDVTFLVLLVTISCLAFDLCAKSRRQVDPQTFKEGWKEKLENLGKSDLPKGEGERIPELEAPDVMVDEFKQPGETAVAAAKRAGEEIYKQYNAELKKEEYDTTQYSKPPPVTTLTEVPKDTYAQLDKGHKKKDTHHQGLEHKTGGGRGALVIKKDSKAPTDITYSQLDGHNKENDSHKKEDTPSHGLKQKAKDAGAVSDGGEIVIKGPTVEFHPKKPEFEMNADGNRTKQ